MGKFFNEINPSIKLPIVTAPENVCHASALPLQGAQKRREVRYMVNRAQERKTHNLTRMYYRTIKFFYFIYFAKFYIKNLSR